jgi:CBS domain-containing protein
MKVKDIMSRDPVCCTTEASLQEVARAMVDRDCGEIPVVESEENLHPVGVITDRDIACRAVAMGRDTLQMTAAECMTSPCLSVTPETALADCCRLMEDKQIRRVLVVDVAGRLCGVVSQADIARHAPERETGRVVHEVSQPRPNGHVFASL